MKKIAVIGSGGSGKSTLALRLGKALGIEVTHLDALLWKPGWVLLSREEQAAAQRTIIERERWIIDGNFGATLAMRVTAADTILLLDLPPALCLWRVIMRRLRSVGRTRPDMAEGCPERLGLSRADREFMARIWNFRENSLPDILSLLQEPHEGRRVITLRSTAAIERFARDIERRIGIVP